MFICLNNGERHLVLPVGFKKLTDEEYERYTALSKEERITEVTPWHSAGTGSTALYDVCEV